MNEQYKGLTGLEYANITKDSKTPCDWHLNGVHYKQNDMVAGHVIRDIRRYLVDHVEHISGVDHVYLINPYTMSYQLDQVMKARHNRLN